MSIHVYYLYLRLINTALIILIEFFLCVLITKTIIILEGSQHVICLDIWKTDCIVFTCCEWEQSTNSISPSKLSILDFSNITAWGTEKHRSSTDNDDYWLKWLYLLAFIGWWLTSLKILLLLKSILILFGVHRLEREKMVRKEEMDIFFSLIREFSRSKDDYKEPIEQSLWL